MSIESRPPREIISHSSPDIGAAEIAAANECLESQQIATGALAAEFEACVAGDLGFAGGVSAATGAQALHLALRTAFPWGGARIGVPSLICRSVHDAVRLAGCVPVILDISEEHFAIDSEGQDWRALDAAVVAHLFGVRAPVERFLGEGPLVIEDCAQRATPREARGSGARASVRILSFAATKMVAAGEGGMALFDDPAWRERARMLRDGDDACAEPALCAPLSDLHAAIGIAQWRRLPEFLKRRSAIAAVYRNAFANVDGVRIDPAMQRDDTLFHRFLLQSADVDGLIEFGKARGVLFRRPVGPRPLHRIFQSSREYPNADAVFERTVSLPIYPRLSWDEAVRVTHAVEAFAAKTPHLAATTHTAR